MKQTPHVDTTIPPRHSTTNNNDLLTTRLSAPNRVPGEIWHANTHPREPFSVSFLFIAFFLFDLEGHFGCL